MRKTISNPLLLYVIGPGRSGSTVLNAYLSRYPGAVALGEIAGEVRHQKIRPTKERECTCGKFITDCPVWSSIPRTAKNLEDWYADVLHSPALKKYSVIVDASKTKEGFQAASKIAKDAGYDVCAVFLMKDPCAWAYSMRRTDSAPPIIGDVLNFKRWVQLRWRFTRFLRKTGISYTTLRYKDFCTSPSHVSEALISEFGLPPFSGWNAASSSTHMTGGGRVRLDASRLNTIRCDTAWKQDNFLRLVRPFTFFLGSHAPERHTARNFEVQSAE
jgi:hypothetical protein